MEFIPAQQSLTVVAFLGVLIAVWYWISANRGVLGQKLASGQRMRVTQVTAISPQDRAILLTVDNREFLVITNRKAAPVVTPLGDAPAPEEAAQ